MDLWQRAKGFAEEAAKRSQEISKEAAKRSQELTKGAARFSQEFVSETAKKSKEIASEAAKKADLLRSEALRAAEQIKTLAVDIPIPMSSTVGQGSNAAVVPEPGSDLERFGVTEELREFVKGITISTFRDFPMQEEEVEEEEGEEEERHTFTSSPYRPSIAGHPWDSSPASEESPAGDSFSPRREKDRGDEISNFRLPVRGSPATGQFHQKSAIGGQFRPSVADFDRRWPISKEIDRRRSIEEEKGKKKRKRKKKEEGKKEYLANAVARGSPARRRRPRVARFFSRARRRSVSPREETDRGDCFSI
ncbi:hypothetical protein GW17_00016655 [Ensete ventricosum]|nr:hypothetical protein GW17_00016655 [Ensete ventricosum]